MQCRNHPESIAGGRCAGCAEEFCPSCLVQIQGQTYCASCKVMMATADPQASLPTVQADGIPAALACSILGVAGLLVPLLGLIFAGIGIGNANKARKAIAANPRLGGAATAKAAYIIGICFLVISIISWIVNAAVTTRHH